MGVKLILAGLALAGFVAVGCESHEHHHHSSNTDHSRQPVGYSSGGYYGNGGYYDRSGHYHRYDNAYPAGGRVEPYHDRDGDRNHDGYHNHDHDGDHDRD